MKVDRGVWTRRGRAALAVNTALGLLICVGAAHAAAPLGPSDRPEAYFNGTSYIRLSRPISLKQLVGLSFRTCVGGELFSQRFEGYTLHVTALLKQVVVSWARPGQPQREASLDKSTLDNRWHWVALNYQPNPPSLALEVDRDLQVISNLSMNPELLTPGALEAGGAVVLVGNVFSGCIHEGPQLEFHASAQLRNVEFGNCPLSTTNNCTDRVDVLRRPPKDHCYNEPCMRHGTCISRHDKYECHCSARYTGNNCEVDAGDPCASAPCQHGGRCVEDARGDYQCECTPRYHGMHCELQVSEDPLCVAGPCRNNGSCSVLPGADSYICACPSGYTGRNCETDVDECAAGAGVACLNGGRCVDAVNNFTCECSGTGYTGPRCESNVNECEEERGVCGHGVCYDTYGGFVCLCQPGYTGERCHRMSPCSTNPCGANGVCIEDGADFRCKCNRGYLPPLCAPAPSCDIACPPRSHCKDTGLPSMVTGVMVSKQVMCVCDIGYYGAPGLSPNCTTLEMACESGVCQNGATCSLGTDHFNCTCAPGYKGAYCELAAGKALSDLKAPPERCASQPCVHADDCVDLPSGFRCECAPGWTGARCDAEACARPCLNGGACVDGACECRAGYAGAACELPDCRALPCPAPQECTEHGGAWRCVAAAAEAACASSPCRNGTCLPLDGGAFRCQCPHGVTGRFCEMDVDECAIMPKICNHGVCVNVPGSYQCYCRPGYTGDSCEQDIDECLSAPCKNGGSCQNLENNFECACKEGFEGKDCSVNINECESSPCAAGSTCVDGVASYTCVCQDGLTGPTCETNIDDCQSQPCQHGGRCIDGLNSYTCDCSDTGYTGAHCAVNVDECAPAPCRNGGTCRDLVNDHRCDCHPGFTGKNCEIDINECESSPCLYDGVCVERSNASLYRAEGGSLPAVFYQPFSLENAAGYECICVPGTTGARCEVNVDECASSPCRHGKCVDGVGSYRCECAPGYEGEHCETDIDECARYEPCAHGRCFDARASYYCACEPGWGGRNCSVVLEGCRGQPCRNNGTCLPWLRRETEHRFNCSCAPGHHGTTCEKVTTMSLEKRSYAEVNTPREEGYDISFRFKTTLGNGLLAMGRGLTYFFLELSNGRLNLHSSLLNKWEGVFIGSNLNDSTWQKVFVTINTTHLVLAANEEQTIYPISQNEVSQNANTSVTSFPSTRLGTAGSSYETLTHGPNFFVGCFQDVVVNNQWVLPEDANATTAEDEDDTARAHLHGVLASCPRAPQCEPNPCRSGGACEDAWTSFVCTCPRPHLGHTCQYNYTAATFGQESATPRSIVTVAVRPEARRAVHAALDISMFVRTRKPTGQIFHLGSAPRYGQTDETLVGASLKGGELLVHLRFNQTPEDYTVGGTRLDNGYLHLIQVVRNSTLVQVKLNGTEYFRKSISAAKQLDAQMLYLGGPPPAPAPPEDLTTASPSSPSSLTPTSSSPPPREPSDADYFKGVIQDVQVSNGVNVTIVEFFPLRVEGLRLPASFGDVTLDPAGVLPGEVSDDACAAQPCLHNASCAVTWNDYNCTCPRGYKGKQCAEVEFCEVQECPLNSHCRNLDGGYECVSNATFDGVNTTLSYRLRNPRAAGDAPLQPPESLTITYRTKVGGTLFRAESASGEEWFTVGVYKQQATLEWRLGGALPAKRSLRRAAHAHTHWTTLRLVARRDTLSGAFIDAAGHEESPTTADVDQAAWQKLLLEGTIYLGGGVRTPTAQAPTESSTDVAVFEYTEGDDFGSDNLAGKYFKGCMGAVYVGNLLLPFFTDEELFVGSSAAKFDAQPHYALIEGKPWGAELGVRCVLCLEQDCARGGRCADVRSSYACTCPPGYAGDYCEVDIDECESNECQNGATCRDHVARYSCECPPGFDGDLCEHDIDECESSPCLHGGECADAPGGFACACPAEWGGARCQLPHERSCAHRPCQHGAACADAPPEPPTGNNYTCTCTEGFVGAHCEHAFCELAPCVHGACLADAQVPSCECEPGYAGPRCETERDECAERGGAACQHGGRCAARRGGVVCDCEGTGWTGAHCEVDEDECAAGRVSCGPGQCQNLDGSYTCICEEGYCGHECALPDPCANATGPCEHGGRCRQRCGAAVGYVCECVDGWAGANCSQQSVSESSEGGGASSSTVLIAAGCALLAAALAAAALGALCAQARRKRATRGTYSPSGQEYCNPRAEMMHHALKPPPEERLI